MAATARPGLARQLACYTVGQCDTLFYMTTDALLHSAPPAAATITCVLCTSEFASEPGPEICGACLCQPGRFVRFAGRLSPAARNELRRQFLVSARAERQRSHELTDAGLVMSGIAAAGLSIDYRDCAKCLR